MFKNIFTVFLVIFVCVACDPDDEGSSVILPTELNTSLIIDEGLVEVQASAQGANFYSFMFYDGEDSTYTESNDGSANYTFARGRGLSGSCSGKGEGWSKKEIRAQFDSQTILDRTAEACKP